MSLRSRRKPEPLRPFEEAASQLRFAKTKYRVVESEPTNTRELAFRKIHPEVLPEFRAWLRRQPCSVEGKTDHATGQVHVCWSPDRLGSRFMSDPCHTGKAYSGALKRTDVRGMWSLCRHAHRQSEDVMDAFDLRYQVNRHEIASEQYDRFIEEKERFA